MAGFDPDQYLNDTAPQFDPDAYLAEPEERSGPKTGAGQAFLESAGNALTLGHLPHLQALTEKLMPNPNAELDEDLERQGFRIEQSDPTYVESRDSNIKRQALQRDEHPVASGLGTAAGIVSGGVAMAPLLPVAAGATGLARAAQAAKAGAGMGALSNPGDKEGEVDVIGDIKGRLGGAALGAAVGPVADKAIGVAGKYAGELGSYLKDKASEKAFRALGRPTPTQMKKMTDSGLNKEIGRELLDEGAIPVLGTPKRISKRVDALKEDAGQEIGDLLDSAGDSKLVDAKELADELLASPAIEEMRFTPGMEGAAEKIAQQLSTLASNGKLSLREAQALRQRIDRSINFNKRAPDMGAAQEGLYLQRTKIRDAMNDGINSLDSSAPKDRLLAANRKYSHMADADEILERELAREQSNRAVSLTDTIAGAGGMATGNPAAGLALGAVNKFGRTFGNSMQARGYDAMAAQLAKIPRFAALAESNPAAFQGLVSRMAQRSAGEGGLERQQEHPIFKNQKLMERFEQKPELIDSVRDDRLRALLNKRFNRSPSQTKEPISTEEAKRRFMEGN